MGRSDETGGPGLVAALKLKQGQGMLEDNDPAQSAHVVNLQGDRVREGDF